MKHLKLFENFNDSENEGIIKDLKLIIRDGSIDDIIQYVEMINFTLNDKPKDEVDKFIASFDTIKELTCIVNAFNLSRMYSTHDVYRILDTFNDLEYTENAALTKGNYYMLEDYQISIWYKKNNNTGDVDEFVRHLPTIKNDLRYSQLHISSFCIIYIEDAVERDGKLIYKITIPNSSKKYSGYWFAEADAVTGYKINDPSVVKYQDRSEIDYSLSEDPNYHWNESDDYHLSFYY